MKTNLVSGVFRALGLLVLPQNVSAHLLGKLWQPWKLLEFLTTSNLASCKLVSYKKECIKQYAIKKAI